MKANLTDKQIIAHESVAPLIGGLTAAAISLARAAVGVEDTLAEITLAVHTLTASIPDTRRIVKSIALNHVMKDGEIKALTTSKTVNKVLKLALGVGERSERSDKGSVDLAKLTAFIVKKTMTAFGNDKAKAAAFLADAAKVAGA